MNRRVEEIDLVTLLRPIVEARGFIAVGLVIGAALAAGAFFALPREYEAKATLTVIDQSEASTYSRMIGQFSGLASAIGAGGLSTYSFADEAVAVLNSRELSGRFLESVDGKRVLLAGSWDEELNQWKDPEAPPSDADAWTAFDKSVRSVEYDSETGIVTVTMILGDPVMVADWLTEFIALADQTLRERAISDSRASLGNLRKLLIEAGLVELRQSINELIEVQLNKEMMARVQPEYAYRVIDPPVASGEDDYVNPNLLLLLILGAVAGMSAGFVLQRWLVIRSRLPPSDR